MNNNTNNLRTYDGQHGSVKTFTNETYMDFDTKDVLNYVTRTSTQEQRKKFNIGSIMINALVCLKCKDYIRSKHRRDFKKCKCGACYIDGGSHYQRVGGNPEYMVVIQENFWVPQEVLEVIRNIE